MKHVKVEKLHCCFHVDQLKLDQELADHIYLNLSATSYVRICIVVSLSDTMKIKY